MTAQDFAMLAAGLRTDWSAFLINVFETLQPGELPLVRGVAHRRDNWR